MRVAKKSRRTYISPASYNKINKKPTSGIITEICWKIILKPTHKWCRCYHCKLHVSMRMGWAESNANFGAHSMDRPSSVVVHAMHHLQHQYLHSLQTICTNLQNWTPWNVDRLPKSTLVFIPSFGEVTYSLVLGQKNLPRNPLLLPMGQDVMFFANVKKLKAFSLDPKYNLESKHVTTKEYWFLFGGSRKFKMKSLGLKLEDKVGMEEIYRSVFGTTYVTNYEMHS